MHANQTILDRVVDAIQVPDSKYESANRSFNSICEWFQRPESTIKNDHLESFLQGSFRLGTAIRPTTDDDDYDLDIVVTLKASKKLISQADLKRKVGVEVRSYSHAHSMTRPIDARRCWTQDYADESQFHVDILPSIPDEQGLRERLEARDLGQAYVETAIGITDQKDGHYNTIHPSWPNSNPRGFAVWFEGRMADTLSKRKAAIALMEAKSVEDIPSYRARVPLQRAIQLLKFHRNMRFADDPDDRPISIIITTLAAMAYRGEASLEAALETILRDMHLGIKTELGIDWVRNPTNEMENFADKWIEYPKRRVNFYDWLDSAREDFARLRLASYNNAEQIISEIFGDEVKSRYYNSLIESSSLRKKLVLSPSHRQAPPWDPRSLGRVRIVRATKLVRGFRPQPFSSNASAIPKNATLHFYGKTDIPAPYEVYWQITNTGEEASSANGLRGGFDTGAIYSGKINRRETTSYRGVHSIECFIVKDGYLAARSGQFIVNIC